MLTREFDYDLPEERIAQVPVEPRDGSRLMVIDRRTGNREHRIFRDLPDVLRPGDLLVLNDSRVIPARLRGTKEDTGGEIEILLLEASQPLQWWTLLRPGKRVRPGTPIRFRFPDGRPSPLQGIVLEKNAEGWCHIRFSGVPDLLQALDQLGELPLPPYIQSPNPADRGLTEQRYQTVYARHAGSVAAPTAGLHFSETVFENLRARGIETAWVTLHVGHGTFAPVKAEEVQDHTMHEEVFNVPETTAATIQKARAEGRRVIAVGTTTVRVLESVARKHDGVVTAGPGRTAIFIYPPATFQAIDGLLTNFHLPQSTLLMLVSAFAAPGRHPEGRDLMLAAYREAIAQHYRFFSYGDAMLIL
jgi:S-adenosylmethionine:tRNA ribosyltransferase-isomerase